MRKLLLICIAILPSIVRANYILIPMDNVQTNHLKAYGIAYWILRTETEVDWLLNYRGGSFMCKYHPAIQNECMVRGVKHEIISDAQANNLLAEIASPALNYDVMKLEKYPRIAVYSPKTAKPWDDAVTLALTYAEIPYDLIYDDEVMAGAWQNTTGCICTTKILQGNTESFMLLTRMHPGTSANNRKLKKRHAG